MKENGQLTTAIVGRRQSNDKGTISRVAFSPIYGGHCAEGKERAAMG